MVVKRGPGAETQDPFILIASGSTSEALSLFPRVEPRNPPFSVCHFPQILPPDGFLLLRRKTQINPAGLLLLHPLRLHITEGQQIIIISSIYLLHLKQLFVVETKLRSQKEYICFIHRFTHKTTSCMNT